MKNFIELREEIENFRRNAPNCLSTSHTEITDEHILLLKNHFNCYDFTAVWLPLLKEWKVTISARPQAVRSRHQIEQELRLLKLPLDVLDALRGSISGDYQKDVKKLRSQGCTCTQKVYDEAYQIDQQP
jgi:hypothetical protein